MKLYTSIGPNPRTVNMFLQEAGLEIPVQELDLMAGENRQQPYTDINPGGQLPALQTDDGLIIAEVLALTQYLDAIKSTGLFGTTPQEHAETVMWYQRIQLRIVEPMGHAFHYGPGLGLFKDRMFCIPEASAGMAASAREGLKWLDGLIADRETIVPNRFSLVDVYFYCLVNFFDENGQPLEQVPNIEALMQRVGERPAAQATA